MRQPVTVCPQEAERRMLLLSSISHLYSVWDHRPWDDAANIWSGSSSLNKPNLETPSQTQVCLHDDSRSGQVDSIFPKGLSAFPIHSVLKGGPSKASQGTGEPWRHKGAISHNCDLNFLFRSDGISEKPIVVEETMTQTWLPS